jgi:hypothetical protein
LTALEKHWDESIRQEAGEWIQAFPLLKVSSDISLLGTLVKPVGFFTVDPFSLAFTVREQARPHQDDSLGVSLAYPIAGSKDTLVRLFAVAPEEDLALSFIAHTQGVRVVHGSKHIGLTHLKNSHGKERNKRALLSVLAMHDPKKWLDDMAIDISYETITVFGRAIMGMLPSQTLGEKISKYGSEAKYESVKSAVLF